MPTAWSKRVASSVPLRPVVALVVLAILAAGCSKRSPGDGFPPPVDHTTTAEPTGGRLPLGELTLTSGMPSCEETCRVPFRVDCPDVQQEASGTLVIQSPSDQPRGVLMVFLGMLGTGFEGLNRQWVGTMVEDGFEVVIVSWDEQTPWLQSDSGEEVGPKVLACRPATTIQWTHDNIYTALGSSSAGDGACGFCLTGNSGGASQIAYSLSFYGVAELVDAAVLTNGPVHTDLDEACLGPDPELQYDPSSAGNIDLSYGFSPGTGPCSRHDETFSQTWQNDSIESGGTYSFPHTRVAFVFVQGDPTPAPAHGMFYLQELRDAGSPMVTDQTIPGFTHTILALPAGREAVEEEIVSGG